ncbi:unnamed protein product [Prorocentrum cordatum]|uniref:Calx-beta domain-containing protein n=1 Tax=Prorocentrum cordatum TaxID=2364126 RepID=A0ABN9SVL4_9DINO|nr:unnamed protein product [Polarella glacialis]
MGGQKRSSARQTDHLQILGEDVSKGLKPGTANGKAHNASVHPADAWGQPEHKPNAIFEHVSDVYAVSEAAKQVSLTVRRAGNEQTSASCKIRTVPGTAEAHKDYVPIDEQLDFLPTETEKTVRIQIVEDKKPEATEEFYVELIPVPGNGIVGFKKIATVVVLDSDSQGKLRFETDSMTIAEQTHCVTRKIKVERVDGGVGDMRCAYRTEEASAKAGKDFKETSGELEFPQGVMHAFIDVTILPMSSIDQRKEIFRLIIERCEGDETACFDENTDGGSEAGICTITIESDVSRMKQYNACLNAAATRGLLNMDNVEIGWSRWKDQFAEAIYVGGDAESQADAGVIDWIFHVISAPWKVFFAVVPPTDFCGGKVCFMCALFMIGVCTALIGDLANLLGCALDIPPSICAITFVALGTSLPDTFASKTAAIQDPIADNSIGNVTGSNSVNVFLGLGLSRGRENSINADFRSSARSSLDRRRAPLAAPAAPRADPGGPRGAPKAFARAAVFVPRSSWSVAALYWESEGGEFRVDAGSLGPMVAVFCGCAFCCIALLLARRWVLGAELGGPVLLARMSSAFLVCLWVGYIVASVLIESG